MTIAVDTENRNSSKAPHDIQDATDATVITDATSNTEEHAMTTFENFNTTTSETPKDSDNNEANTIFNNDIAQTEDEALHKKSVRKVLPANIKSEIQMTAKKRFRINLSPIKAIKPVKEKPPIGSLLDSDGSSAHTHGSAALSLQSEDAGGNFLVDFPTSREEFIEHRDTLESITNPSLKEHETETKKNQSTDETDARRPWRKNKPAPKKTSILDSMIKDDVITSTLFDQPPETVNYLDFLDSDQLYKEDLDQYEHIGFAFENDYQNVSHFQNNLDVTSLDFNANNLDDTSVLTDLRLAQTALGWSEDDIKSQTSSQLRYIENTKTKTEDDDDPMQLPNTPIMIELKSNVERRIAAIRARQKLSSSFPIEEKKTTSFGNKPYESKRRHSRRPRKNFVANDREGENGNQSTGYPQKIETQSHDEANQGKEHHHRSKSRKYQNNMKERQYALDNQEDENKSRRPSRSRQSKKLQMENASHLENERRHSPLTYRSEEKNSLLIHDDDYSDEEALPTAVLGEDSDEEAEGRDKFDEEKGPLNLGHRLGAGSLHDGIQPDVQGISNDNLENFRNVFMQGERNKKQELSFHGLWNSKPEDGSDNGSDLSQTSQKSARFQQVKVTMRAKGFGLKMQRIFGPRIWAIKFYILAVFLLLLLILVITIPLAIRNGKKADLGTMSPSMNPTMSPSESIGYTKVSSFYGENSNDRAGSSLAIASDTNVIAIGSPNAATGFGEVRVFTLVESQLLPYGKTLKGKNKGDMFGNSLSISKDGQILAIGSPMARKNEGYVTVFEFNYENQDWVKMGQDITLSEADTFFGSAISLSGNGDRLAIGMPRANDDDGQTLIFHYNSISGIWIRLGQALYGSEKELHGFSVSLDGTGETLAAGAVRSSNGTPNYGRVYLYRWDTTKWVPFGNPIFGRDLIGRSVSLSLDGMRVAIGSTGYDNGKKENVGACAVYGYLGDWEQLGSTLHGKFPEEKSGHTIILSANGQRVACGGPSGSIVRVYEEGESDWELIGNGPLTGGKQQPDSDFGAAIAMNVNGSLLMIGAPKELVKGKKDAGAVRIFQL
jgi:hypothetical protein